MKKIALLLVTFSISAASFAQSDPRFTIGTKGGFGHSFIMPYKNYGFHPLWNIGLATNYQVTQRFAIGVDALYSSEGATFKNEALDITRDVELDYMRIPIRFNLVLGAEGSDFRPRIAVAPTFGVLMAEGTEYKDMDFGLNGSAGFSYEMLEDFWLTLDANYFHGMMDISKAGMKEKNGNLRLEVGFMFGL